MRSLRSVVWCALLALSAARAGAQSGTVRGVVYDSILGAPLAGAEVWLEGLERTAITDPSGAFRLDSVPARAYTITFGHASLDSLGIGAPFGKIEVRDGQTADVRLTTPSLRGIASRLCPTTPLDSLGVLLGVVRDATAGAPMSGAHVDVQWVEWTVGAAAANRVARVDRRLQGAADVSGRFVVCGVPNDVIVGLRATGAGADSTRTTGRVLVDVRERGLTWRNLALGTPPTVGATGASLALTVADQDGRPVAGAQARVGGSGEFRASSDDGRLRLSGLPTGTRDVEVRAIGYESARLSADLTAGREVAQRVVLRRSPVPLLETVRIIGARPYRDITGFEDRRRSSGFGHFMTNAEIERRSPMRFTDLLRRFPGVRISVPRGGGPLEVVSMRADLGGFGNGGVRRQCPLAVYFDDIPLSGTDDFDAIINPYYIRGIEFYPSTAGVPPKYGRSSCGTLLVWSR